jgi:hypothetical protein
MNKEPHFSKGDPNVGRMPLDQLQGHIDVAVEGGICSAVDIEILADTPYTILVASQTREESGELLGGLKFIASKALQRKLDAPKLLFRSVKIERLGHVFRTGCDVVPTDAPIFATEYSGKALEYGGSDKVIMVFDPSKLQKTYKKASKSESPEVLNQLRKEYPSVMEIEPDWLWFSKLPPGDVRIGSSYETEYSFFIPSTPHDALLLIFLVGDDRDRLWAEFLRQTNISAESCGMLRGLSPVKHSFSD